MLLRLGFMSKRNACSHCFSRLPYTGLLELRVKVQLQ